MLLDKPDKDGGTRRKYLLQAAKQTGTHYEELDTPTIPLEMWQEWGWFVDLSSRRRCGFSGPDPITYSDLLAWMEYTGNCMGALQRRMLVDLDKIFLSLHAEVNDG